MPWPQKGRSTIKSIVSLEALHSRTKSIQDKAGRRKTPKSTCSEGLDARRPGSLESYFLNNAEEKIPPEEKEGKRGSLPRGR